MDFDEKNCFGAEAADNYSTDDEETNSEVSMIEWDESELSQELLDELSLERSADFEMVDAYESECFDILNNSSTKNEGSNSEVSLIEWAGDELSRDAIPTQETPKKGDIKQTIDFGSVEFYVNYCDDANVAERRKNASNYDGDSNCEVSTMEWGEIEPCHDGFLIEQTADLFDVYEGNCVEAERVNKPNKFLSTTNEQDTIDTLCDAQSVVQNHSNGLDLASKNDTTFNASDIPSVDEE